MPLPQELRLPVTALWRNKGAGSFRKEMNCQILPQNLIHMLPLISRKQLIFRIYICYQ